MARVDVVFEDERWETLELGKLAEEAAGATLACLGFDPNAFEISVLACDDARIAALNADFRGKPQPTNVLSWPSSERAAKTDGATPYAPDPAQETVTVLAQHTHVAIHLAVPVRISTAMRQVLGHIDKAAAQLNAQAEAVFTLADIHREKVHRR